MSENKDLHEENLNSEQEFNPNIEEETVENVTNEQSAEELLSEEKDRYIRLFAEFENYKKRTAKEKMDFFQYANQDMMISMLDVLDDFERALKNIAEHGNDADLQGVELIYQKFKNKLAEKGLKKIAQKVGEEAVETVIAAMEDDTEAFKNEAADLLFHFLVLLQAKNIKLDDVIGVLKNRRR